jgi:hypothetical protein
MVGNTGSVQVKLRLLRSVSLKTRPLDLTATFRGGGRWGGGVDNGRRVQKGVGWEGKKGGGGGCLLFVTTR